MKVIVTGAGGMVGRALVRQCLSRGARVSGFDHAALDITHHSSLESTLDRERPAALFNCAAWPDVDGCERDPNHARLPLARGPDLLPAPCGRHNPLHITIS